MNWLNYCHTKLIFVKLSYFCYCFFVDGIINLNRGVPFESNKIDADKAREIESKLGDLDKTFFKYEHGEKNSSILHSLKKVFLIASWGLYWQNIKIWLSTISLIDIYHLIFFSSFLVLVIRRRKLINTSRTNAKRLINFNFRFFVHLLQTEIWRNIISYISISQQDILSIGSTCSCLSLVSWCDVHKNLLNRIWK